MRHWIITERKYFLLAGFLHWVLMVNGRIARSIIRRVVPHVAQTGRLRLTGSVFVSDSGIISFPFDTMI